MYVPRHTVSTSRAALTNCYVPAGPNQSHPKKRAEERLVTPLMAPWNVTVHVWFLTFLVHDPGLCLRLSQLIGSTLALEYMRAGTPFHCDESGFPLTQICRICCTAGINFSYLQFPVCEISRRNARHLNGYI